MFINDSFLYWLREATTASLAKPINRAVFDLLTQAVIRYATLRFSSWGCDQAMLALAIHNYQLK